MRGIQDALAERLPHDVSELVLHHLAATRIQVAWLRYDLFRHARQPEWRRIVAHLRRVDVWRPLFPYSAVRREWRTEASSWLHVSTPHPLLVEARHGLWGVRTKRISATVGIC